MRRSGIAPPKQATSCPIPDSATLVSTYRRCGRMRSTHYLDLAVNSHVGWLNFIHHHIYDFGIRSDRLVRHFDDLSDQCAYGRRALNACRRHSLSSALRPSRFPTRPTWPTETPTAWQRQIRNALKYQENVSGLVLRAQTSTPRRGSPTDTGRSFWKATFASSNPLTPGSQCRLCRPSLSETQTRTY